MFPVISTIIFFIVIGGVGMYVGNRKVAPAIAKQRWIKYVVYILITSFVVLSIWFHFFLPVTVFIVFAGYFELGKTIRLTKKSWLAIVIYSIIVSGFIFYAWTLEREFQFSIYLQILSFDAFSQVTGQLIGKKAIAPKISPTKTVEGFLGGVFFSVLASGLTSSWMRLSLVEAIAFGLLTALTGFFGDLLASFYKRIAGIKDYSNLLPGQGGFLDRFDSFMIAAFFYSLLYLILPGIFPT